MDLKILFDKLDSLSNLDDEVLLVGGGSNSKLWGQIMADVLNRKILKTNIGQDAAALGAAAIAAVGIGFWKDFNKIDLDRGGLDGKEVSDVYKELDEKSIKCPRCGEELKKELYPKGIRIDTCAKCDGIWLDGGEIHKLRERTLVKLADTVYTLKIAFAQALRSALQGRKKRKI